MAKRAVKYVIKHYAYWSPNGHSSHASTVTRTSDGKRISFTHDGDSNAESGLWEMVGKYPGVLSVGTTWLKCREYNEHVKGLPHFHGAGAEMAKQIRAAFRKA